ncbi:MAG: CPBP family intramembrane glutamic endopeptidase [Candidatus Asgardarchaeia archaeon]
METEKETLLFEVILFMTLWYALAVALSMVRIEIYGSSLDLHLLVFTILVAVYFSKKHFENPISSLGFEINLKMALLSLGFFLLGVMAIGLIVVLFLSLDLATIEIAKENIAFETFIITFLNFFILAMIEEIVFRGYMISVLKKAFSALNSILISGLLFALLHIFTPNFSIISFIQLFTAGALLGFAYIKTRNIYTVTAFHFAWNISEGLIFGLPVSGHRYQGIIKINPLDNILTGGAYGPEGGLIGVVITVLIFIMLIIFYCRSIRIRDCMEEENY